MTTLPIARIRIKVPTARYEAGTELEATAIIYAGYTFYEVGGDLISNLEADLIEEYRP